MNALNLQLQPQPQLYAQIYGRLQNAKRNIRLVNAILHALQMIASRPRQTVKRNARFARPNMIHFEMLSSLSMSRNKMGIDITCDHVINQNKSVSQSLLHSF